MLSATLGCFGSGEMSCPECCDCGERKLSIDPAREGIVTFFLSDFPFPFRFDSVVPMVPVFSIFTSAVLGAVSTMPPGTETSALPTAGFSSTGVCLHGVRMEFGMPLSAGTCLATPTGCGLNEFGTFSST